MTTKDLKHRIMRLEKLADLQDKWIKTLEAKLESIQNFSYAVGVGGGKAWTNDTYENPGGTK